MPYSIFDPYDFYEPYGFGIRNGPSLFDRTSLFQFSNSPGYRMASFDSPRTGWIRPKANGRSRGRNTQTTTDNRDHPHWQSNRPSGPRPVSRPTTVVKSETDCKVARECLPRSTSNPEKQSRDVEKKKSVVNSSNESGEIVIPIQREDCQISNSKDQFVKTVANADKKHDNTIKPLKDLSKAESDIEHNPDNAYEEQNGTLAKDVLAEKCHLPEAEMSDLEENEDSKLEKLNDIHTIAHDVSELGEKIQRFSGNFQSKEYLYLEEMLTRCLLKLDTISTDGIYEIRKARKALAEKINSKISLLEEMVKGNGTENIADNLVSNNSQEDKKEINCDHSAAQDTTDIETDSHKKTMNVDQLVTSDQEIADDEINMGQDLMQDITNVQNKSLCKTENTDNESSSDHKLVDYYVNIEQENS